MTWLEYCLWAFGVGAFTNLFYSLIWEDFAPLGIFGIIPNQIKKKLSKWLKTPIGLDL